MNKMFAFALLLLITSTLAVKFPEISLEDKNTEICKNLINALEAYDIDVIDKMTTDDLTWKVMMKGSPNTNMDKQTLLTLFSNPPTKNFNFVILDTVAQRDRVALEVTVEAIMIATGEPYNNEYHFKCYVRDGKVALVKEYFDSALAVTS